MPFIPFSNPIAHKPDEHKPYSAAIMDCKDRRAMHTDRQHVLHASDRRKAKAGRSSRPRDGSGPRDIHYPEVTAHDFSVNHTLCDDTIWPEATDSFNVGASMPRAAPQVSLAEIIRPGRKRKGVAGDFEIVPRPSEVLVLPMDEGFEDENDDLYAGWEDISLGALRGTSVGHESRTGVATGGAQLKFPPVSYAAALSAHQ